MHVSRKSRQKLHAELKRIASLQSEWNALSMPERARIAVASPDLSLFFRPSIGTGVQATGRLSTCLRPRGGHIAEGLKRGLLPCGSSSAATSSGSHVRINNRSDVHA